MTTPIFKLTTTDLQTHINPTGQDGYFKVGSKPGQVPAAVAESTLLNFESRVVSSIPEKYRVRTDRIEGLIAVRWATEGQTTFTPPVTIGSDLQVFVNYPGNFGNGMLIFGATQRPYSSRTALDATIGCTVDDETNVVTLPVELTEGDHVIIDFNHDAMEECLELRMCILEMAGAEMLRSMPGLGDNVSDRVEKWELNAYSFLKRMWNADNNYKTGVQFFDRLKLVSELETRISGGVRHGVGIGGMLI